MKTFNVYHLNYGNYSKNDLKKISNSAIQRSDYETILANNLKAALRKVYKQTFGYKNDGMLAMATDEAGRSLGHYILDARLGNIKVETYKPIQPSREEINKEKLKAKVAKL